MLSRSINSPPIPYLFNIKKGLERWNNKIRRIDSGENLIADVAVTGNSVSEGYNAGVTTLDLMNLGYKGLFSSYCNSKYDDVGRGYLPLNYPYNKSYTTFTGSWGENGYGFMQNGHSCSTSGATISFTFNGTGLEIWAMRHSNGSKINVSIDGGTTTEFSLLGTTTFPYRLTIASGLTNGPHTCLITQTESKYFNFAGWMEKKGSRGVRVNMCSRSGGDSNFLGWTDSLPYFASLNADLTILSIGVNDFGNQNSISTMKSKFQTFINSVKPYSDILITTVVPSDQTKAAPYSNFYDAIVDVALSNELAFFDYARYVRGAVNMRNNGLYSDNGSNIHLGPIGHRLLTNKLLEILKV